MIVKGMIMVFCEANNKFVFLCNAICIIPIHRIKKILCQTEKSVGL